MKKKINLLSRITTLALIIGLVFSYPLTTAMANEEHPEQTGVVEENASEEESQETQPEGSVDSGESEPNLDEQDVPSDPAPESSTNEDQDAPDSTQSEDDTETDQPEGSQSLEEEVDSEIDAPTVPAAESSEQVDEPEVIQVELEANSPTDVGTDAEEQLTGSDQETESAEDIISEIFSDAAEQDIAVVAVAEDGEALPLVTVEATETIVGGDPYFQDAAGEWIGYTKLGGTCDPIVTTCNQVANPVQSAVNVAPAGATVYVEKDTYTENVTINTSLTLAGLWQGNENPADRPTIEGTITINAINVWLHGLVVDATGNAFGIIVNADNATISNSQIENAGVGVAAATEANIHVDNADGVTIDNNTIQESPLGDGVRLDNATNATVTNNIIDKHGYSSLGPNFAGVMVINGDGNETIQNNNITDNMIGVAEIGTPGGVTAEGNYFDGNDVKTDGTVDIDPELAAPAALPVNRAHPPAPGGGAADPGEVELPDLEPGPGILTSIDGDFPACGAPWSKPFGVPDDGSYVRYQGNTWVKYDQAQGGYVYWSGDSNGEILRKEDGTWHSLSPMGKASPLPLITDNNWSVVDGNWCYDGGAGWSLYQDCTLYYFSNGQFDWAQHSSGAFYRFNQTTSHWEPSSNN
jgi:hypothetical protein